MGNWPELRKRENRRWFNTAAILRTTLAIAFWAWFAPNSQAAQEQITFAYSSISPDAAGIWMAKEIRAFEKNELNANLVYISSGAVVVQALVGGSVHAALGASNAVVSAILKGAPIIAVAGNTSHPTLVLWVQPEIERAEQLQGKILAVTRYGSTTDFLARLMLRKLGLEGKVSIRPFGGVVEADVGFRSRQADARVSSQKPDPQARMLVDAGDMGIPFSDDFLAVSGDFYRRSPKSVEKILMAYVEGIAALRTKKQQALEVLAKYMKQRGGSAEVHYEFVVKHLEPIPRIERAAVETVLQMVGHSGAVQPEIFDNTLIDKLVQAGFIEKLYKGRTK